jgi:hypothetical protein
LTLRVRCCRPCTTADRADEAKNEALHTISDPDVYNRVTDCTVYSRKCVAGLTRYREIPPSLGSALDQDR